MLEYINAPAAEDLEAAFGPSSDKTKTAEGRSAALATEVARNLGVSFRMLTCRFHLIFIVSEFSWDAEKLLTDIYLE